MKYYEVAEITLNLNSKGAGSSFPQKRKKETAHVRNYQKLTERHIFHVKRQ